MASWTDFAAEAPELAAKAQAFLDAGVHKTLATLRRDGSPRISGTEARFHDGELWIGSMPGAMKARDLQRDPRYALHSASEDPPGWKGDAKIAGRAEEITGEERIRAVVEAAWPQAPEGPMHLFRLDVDEVVVIGLDGDPPDALLVTSWHPGRGVETVRR